MSLFSLFDPAVALVHTGLTTIASGLDPLLGGASVAVALVPGSRRQPVRRDGAGAGAAFGTSRQQVQRLRAASTGEVAPVSLMLARVLPYGSVLMAAVVPVAVSLYLLTSTTWMLAERAVLPRLF